MVSQSTGDLLIKRIVVAVDGSIHSEKALRHAIALAKGFNAEIHIVHAIKQVEITNYVLSHAFSSKAALTVEDLYRDLTKAASSWIQGYEDKAKSSGVKFVTTKILAETGKSEVEMIANHAQSVKADMIIVGSRGLGTFKRLLLGSVASGLVSHGSCTVLVVR